MTNGVTISLISQQKIEPAAKPRINAVMRPTLPRLVRMYLYLQRLPCADTIVLQLSCNFSEIGREIGENCAIVYNITKRDIVMIEISSAIKTSRI